MQDQIARNLEKGVADEENADKESKLLAGDAQFRVHGQCGKPNVDAIKKSNNVENQYEGENSDPHIPNRSCFNGHRNGVCLVAHGQLVRTRAVFGSSIKNIADTSMEIPTKARPQCRLPVLSLIRPMA